MNMASMTMPTMTIMKMVHSCNLAALWCFAAFFNSLLASSVLSYVLTMFASMSSTTYHIRRGERQRATIGKCGAEVLVSGAHLSLLAD